MAAELAFIDGYTLSLMDASEAKFDGIANRILSGYFNWQGGDIYYSPALGPCPFMKMPKETRVFPANTYRCPFPIGDGQMWSGQLELPSDASYQAALKELGFA